MTLQEARTILDNYRPHRKEVREAVGIAARLLPSDGHRLSPAERFEAILGAISRQKGGYNPFDRTRRAEPVTWRQLIYKRMKDEGYPIFEIAKVTGYDHSTIFCGIQRANDGIACKDWMTVKINNELIEILEHEKGTSDE